MRTTASTWASHVYSAVLDLLYIRPTLCRPPEMGPKAPKSVSEGVVGAGCRDVGDEMEGMCRTRTAALRWMDETGRRRRQKRDKEVRSQDLGVEEIWK